MATLQQAITQAAALVGAITGIRAAPDVPPENMSFFPFAVLYAGSGEATFDATQRLNLDTIIVELHVARKDLPRDVSAAMPFVDSIPNALMGGVRTNKWSGTIETLDGISWTFGDLGWNDVPTIGFRFSVNGVKRHIAFT